MTFPRYEHLGAARGCRFKNTVIAGIVGDGEDAPKLREQGRRRYEFNVPQDAPR